MLEVRLIGTFAMKCDGNPVTLSARAAQSLLAYLILTAGTLHRREKLAGMFWPDETEEKARAYLRTELWRIRKSISNKSKIEYLLTDDLTIGFNPSAAHWSDVAQLNNISEMASIEELMNAISVFQGELLPGFYEDWVVLEREHLQATYETKMARLLELLEYDKRWYEIVEWAERWISFGQKPENAYLALIVAYDALGNQAKVASTYERCVRALRELDLEPSEQIRALAFKRTTKLNIPIPLTSFIGREKELKEVAKLLSSSRLVTLTGSGGIGKSRFSIQVLAEVLELFPDGVWFLNLAPLSDPTSVPNALASLLGIRESGENKSSVTSQLVNYLRSRTALVIFDNCEHLIESCAQIMYALLTACESLTILATSREALQVSGEIPYRIPSLDIPEPSSEFDIEAFSKVESVRLFIDRALVTSASFAISPRNALAIAQICHRLDGIPLAIELAAARVNMLPVIQILERLDNRFNILTSGLRTALPRHQTLRATIDWSYDLLSEKERLLFRRLAVFMGGWSLAAAEFVCSADGIEVNEIIDLLTNLVNKSLILTIREQGKDTRYHMLETIRQYALEKLKHDRELALKHCIYFSGFVGGCFPAIYTHEQQEMIGKLILEISNIRLAWAHALQHGQYREIRSIGQTLGLFFEFSNHLSEGGAWYEEAIRTWDEHPVGDPLARSAFGLCLAYYGYYEWRLGRYENAMQRLKQSAEILRALNDPLLYFPLAWIGATLVFGGQVQQAWQYLDESEQALIKTDPALGMWMVEWLRGIVFIYQGDIDQAKKHLLLSVEWCRKTGDPRASTNALSFLSHAYSLRGEFSEAESTVLESLAQSKARNDTFSIGVDLTHLGNIALAQGNIQEAFAAMSASLSLFESIGDQWNYLRTLYELGNMQQTTKQLDDALKSYSRVVDLANKAGILRRLLDGVVGWAEIMLQTGDKEKAIKGLMFVQAHPSASPVTKARAVKALQDMDVDYKQPVILSLEDILHNVK